MTTDEQTNASETGRMVITGSMDDQGAVAGWSDQAGQMSIRQLVRLIGATAGYARGCAESYIRRLQETYPDSSRRIWRDFCAAYKDAHQSAQDDQAKEIFAIREVHGDGQ